MTHETLTTINTFADLLKVSREIFTNGTTFEQYKQFGFFLLDNPDTIKTIISKETIQSLKRFVYHADKKEKMVRSVYSTVCSNLTFGGFQWSPMEETSDQALRRILNGYTEEQYLKYKAELQAERDAKEKALNNPETLEEFRTFINYKGEKALNEEQRIKYDELTADTRRIIKDREEERKAEVKKVENVNAEMQIKESFHAKKLIPLWVVILSARVDRPTYEALNERAKKLGGYYSSYKGNGAIPGFTFDKKEAAELFAKVKDENVNASEIKAEEKEEKKQTRAEALREKGEAMIATGNEELSKDRQANTHRRARFAAHAEDKATGMIEFGKTLVKIATMMEAGEIKYLDKISNSKDLQELNNIITSASYSHMRDKNINSNSFELSLETVNYAQIPYPGIYKSNSGEIERMAENSAGKKLAAARLLKALGNREHITINSKYLLEDYETVFCKLCSVIDRWRIDRYKDQLMRLKRINRIGIDTIEELRAALRELIQLKKGETISEEQKRELEIKGLERKFLGKKIDGFFPTPEDLGGDVVRKARIEEGNTICEPSAGLGHLADVISELHPDNDLLCIEQYQPLHEALQLKGYNAINEDFLSYTGQQFDRIIMNPPFENRQDESHVLHAFTLLKPGGRIVAIMADNKDQERKKDSEFSKLLDEYGTSEKNEAGAFSSAFRPTGVNTITVVIDKPI